MTTALLSNSGNVGKTTIAREVLALNMDNALLLELETHNAGNKKFEDKFFEYKKINAIDFKEIYRLIVTREDVVLDIGSSNLLEFFKQLDIYHGVGNIIDLYVIPTTKDGKQLKDTETTIKMLVDIFDIDTSKIIVILNRATPISLEKDFDSIFAFQKKYKFHTGRDFMINESSTLKDLELENLTLKEVMEDETDFRIKIKETSANIEEQNIWIAKDLTRMASKKLYSDFNRIFNVITENIK